MRNHVGPYQRPAPPKKPLGLGASKAIQKPAVPMHEIEAQAQVVLQGMIEKVRKPGRPLVHEELEEPMTAAQRQARRRGIRDALMIGDGEGKSGAEAASGGWGSYEIDRLNIDDEPNYSRRVRPKPAGDDSKLSSKLSHKVQVGGLRIGNEEVSRRLFAEGELRKMVWEYFESPTVSPSAQWISKQIANTPIQLQRPTSLVLSCRACGDVMESIDNATDHLRVDHRKLISEWFALLNPPREFRDTGFCVTVVMPRKRKKRL
jgi:hypothetical protein